MGLAEVEVDMEAYDEMAKDTATVEQLNTEEYRFLQVKFSSGVTFSELKSIAALLASLAQITPPSRDEKRHYFKLIKWFRDSWAVITPFITVMELRDQFNVPIDSQREMVDKGVKKWIYGE
jgi:hypothetical protein